MFDTFMLHALIDELNESISTFRIQRILSPGPMRYILRFRKDKQLLISLDPSRCYAALLTAEERELDSPTPFSLYLRKTLQGARLMGIHQRAFDRVMELTFLASTSTLDKIELTLIAEFMGRHANLLLTDAQGKILQALKYTPHLSSSEHIVRIGRVYQDMPSHRQNPLVSTLPSQSYREVAGYTPRLMRILPEEMKRKEIFEISEWLLQQKSFSLYLDETGSPFDFHRFENPSFRTLSFATPSSLITSYYRELSRKEHTGAFKRRFEQLIDRRIERVERKLQKQRQELLQTNEADQLKEKADILLANIHSLPKRASQAHVYDFYRDEMITVELEERFTVSQNAQQLYKKYEKARRAKELIDEQIKKSLEEHDRLEQLRFDLSIATSTLEMDAMERALVTEGYLQQKKQKTLPPPSAPRQFHFHGATYLVGRNAVQNNEITFRNKNREHLWYHAKDIPGSHIILQLEEQEATAEQILFGAMLAAFFSKDRGKRVEVDRTQLKNVRKYRGSPLGKVTYTKQKTMMVDASAEEILPFETKNTSTLDKYI